MGSGPDDTHARTTRCKTPLRLAGSWAIYALLALAGATAVTGWLHYNAGGGERFEEVHELLANAWLVMVVIHVAGVIVGSVAHRRNLVATMITGQRAGAGMAGTRPGWVLGSALLATVLGFWTWSATTGGGSLLAGAEGSAGGHEQDGLDARERGADEHENEDDD